MIKFLATDEGGAHTVGLLLDDDNLNRLRAGDPIMVDLGAELLPGIPVSVLIGFASRADGKAMLAPYMTAETVEKIYGPGEPNPSNPGQR